MITIPYLRAPSKASLKSEYHAAASRYLDAGTALDAAKRSGDLSDIAARTKQFSQAQAEFQVISYQLRRAK